jgi:hypothetical protein
MKNLFRTLCLSFLFVACSTTEKARLPEIPITPRLDYAEIQNRLELDMRPEESGFKEKIFDACYLGGELTNLRDAPSNCHHAYFTVVQFQLSCRGSEESAAVLTESDLTPVKIQNINWVIARSTGSVQTDYSGRAMIRFISGKSAKKSMMRLSTGTDFLNMRTEQATEIVTPPSWCGQP